MLSFFTNIIKVTTMIKHLNNEKSADNSNLTTQKEDMGNICCQATTPKIDVDPEKDTVDSAKELEFYEHNFTAEKITECVNKCGYEPKSEYVINIAKNIQKIPVQERGMFLAQIIHESAGLTAVEEIEFSKQNKIAHEYHTNEGFKNKSYHGRSFIQLTWPYNYKEASQYLGLGDLLLREPELVIKDLKICWGVTEFYWNEKVSTNFNVQRRLFWATTFAINPNECIPGKEDERAKNRYKYYLNVAKIMGEKEPAKKGLEELNEAIEYEKEQKQILDKKAGTDQKGSKAQVSTPEM